MISLNERRTEPAHRSADAAARGLSRLSGLACFHLRGLCDCFVCSAQESYEVLKCELWIRAEKVSVELVMGLLLIGDRVSLEISNPFG